MKKGYIDPSASISENTILGENVFIGPNCIIGFQDYTSKISTNHKKLKKVIIGDNTKILGNSVICQGSKIGKNNRIDYHSYIGENVTTGINVDIKYGARIYSNVTIKNFTSISSFIAKNCQIGSYCIIQGDLIHKFVNVIYGIDEPAPTIENNVFIGKNTMIIGGIVIKKGCYIGSSSVIVKDTKENTLYVGNPAIEKGKAPLPYLKKPNE